jgi:hypothetical protein
VARRLAQLDKQLAVVFVWYDFDSLPVARSRPFRTWSRVRRVIESLTTTVVAAGEAFLAEHPAVSGPVEPLVTALQGALTRLGASL